jgi:hypothetical protein
MNKEWAERRLIRDSHTALHAMQMMTCAKIEVSYAKFR